MKKKIYSIDLIIRFFRKNFTEKYLKIDFIKKYIKNQNFLTIRKKNEKDQLILGNIFRTFLSSAVIIASFSVAPLVVDFAKSRTIFSNNYENNSKNKLKTLLENQDSKLDNEVNRKFLYEDVFAFDEQPTDTVRLSAQILEELFKSTNYDLKDVRKNKLVKPISLTLLPNEIKKIESSQKRKDLFIQIILPLVIKENQNIKLDRKKLFKVLNKSKNTKNEKQWLNLKFKQYGVVNKDLSTLKVRMDEVPISMTIAQAAKETGWGTSRFALEGNALFGQWTWSGEGIKPSGADGSTTHKVMKFKVLQASVRAYQRNLNTHSSYKNFRSARAELREEGKKLNSITLSEHLDKYAETGKEYVKVLQQIIKQNNLTDFDDAKLMPSSIDLESLI
ncbi:Bax protein [Candidatus Pelagibacter ubique]|jgi:Bax protein|uniref:Bax protein n=1 Tax=Pelagibacter ubique TaxID=198252 RepID=A0ABX1SZI9_PELUQ|nr:glucosaminidase domain-containing protein [Candidatus Pelagibacter ubique]NMN67257.1 Bax protein [Candidatus Pelagibacter ubique]